MMQGVLPERAVYVNDDDMLTPTGYPPRNTAADTAHSAYSTQAALRPHRATPRVEDKPRNA